MALVQPAGNGYKSVVGQFTRDGYYFPLDAMSRDEAMAFRAEFDALETEIAGRRLGNRGQLNYAHVTMPFADRIVRHRGILDVVETILGPDLLVWGSTFFTKEPHTEAFVSWHQDLRYWGFSGDDEVAGWVALGPVREEHGCMRFVPGSHRLDILEHRDTFDDANFLSRGQEAVIEIDEDKTVMVELEPGQASLHHGPLLHASGPNVSDERRVGMVINYIKPEMKQLMVDRDFCTLVRGQDRFGHFEHVPAPQANFSSDAMAWHQRILDAQNTVIFDGAGVTET
ncbi:MAG: phytanoyl-CoA dioxygenase family protein [Alphaproteobacteria bacterium]|jgi:non-haem Fe2+, alpha-ketoglutarate-dependent halogenase|nr:phytanoyl-CoA dioxygenase family protein [Rhodospirillaceae bacterium]MDG2482971.1 phytanoyl-CoA dioxygenase family protein [Alphaproteobacteria bacterium]MBT6203944.1 phytanoyl-CoA dioxygenase family protein [Rhodospirillaceae bacterium]MBT6510714.1 phytanoyl-CoA dioxygenase family protein [Rhodospirillaceae bacterium]MBT7613509.1 phytanoyl-CoA dioxygenase family protein [Rhodospirillaceae bacterium]